MMKAFSFLTILESLSKKLSILRTKMHSDDLRVDYESITSQSRVSRPFSRTSLSTSSSSVSSGVSFGASFADLSRRASHFAAILTILFTVGVGNVWGETVLFEPTGKTITSGNITVSTGNTTPSELTIADEKTNGWKIDSKGTITISSTLPNIKSITILGCTSSDGMGKELCGDVKVSLNGETFSTIISGVTIVDADGTQTTGAGFALVKKENKPACTMTITFDNTQRYVQISRAASNGKQMNIASISVEKVELQTYDITYQSNGGTTIPKTEGATVIPYSLSVPTKDGCVFVGWYTDSDLTIAAVSGTVLVDNIVLYAKWIEAEEKCITFGSKANISNGSTTTSLDDMQIISSGIADDCTKLDNNADYLTIQLQNNTFLKCFKIYAYSSNGLKIWFSETNTFEDDPLIISLPTNYGWTQVFDIPEDIAYVKIQRENGSVYFTQICLGIVEEQTCTAPTLSYATTAVTKTFGDAAFTNTLTNTNGVAVTYSSTNEKVATVAANGQVTIKGEGETTIKATWEGNATYCEAEASYTLTVAKANISPTLTYNNTSLAIGGTATPTLTGNTGNAEVKYLSSDPEVVEVNESTGVVTAKVEGTATITATIDASENYNGGTATCDITVHCTAPNHVDISGRWDRFGGETISLTAAAYASAGTGSPIADGDITGWQWEKLIGSTWTALSNGTVDGVTTSGATTKNLQIANCGSGNSGKYRCVVSTGATCLTASATATDGTEGFGVKVYVLECYTGGKTEHHFTRNGNTQSGTLTLNLTDNTTYEFKVHVDNDYYGNNGTIYENATNWVCATTQASNLKVFSGYGGTFTFKVDYSADGNSNEQGEPEVSVTYPEDKTIYVIPNGYTGDNAKLAIYYWNDGTSGWSSFLTKDACSGDAYYAEIPSWTGKISIVRLNSDATVGDWQKKWNQTEDIIIDPTKDQYTINTWCGNGCKETVKEDTYTPTTYSITFNENGGTGSMTNVTGITCGGSATLTQNAFTRTGYTFAGWATSDNGEKVYDDKATISNITANITLYAKWTPNANTAYTVKHYKQQLDGTYSATPDETQNLTGTTAASVTPAVKSYEGFTAPSTQTVTIAADGSTVVNYQYTRNSYTLAWNLDGGTISAQGTAAGDVKYGAALTAPTVTKTGYTFVGWSPAVAATMPAENVTYTAQWREIAQTYTITYNLGPEKWATGYTPASTYTAGTEHTLPTIDNLSNEKNHGTFQGWYERADFQGNEVTSIPANATGDKTYYAKWVYDIQFFEVVDEATDTDVENKKFTKQLTGVSYPATYTYGVGITLPDLPAKDGYTADGWYSQWCVYNEQKGWVDACKWKALDNEAYGNVNFAVKYTLNTPVTPDPDPECETTTITYTLVTPNNNTATQNVSGTDKITTLTGATAKGTATANKGEINNSFSDYSVRYGASSGSDDTDNGVTFTFAIPTGYVFKPSAINTNLMCYGWGQDENNGTQLYKFYGTLSDGATTINGTADPERINGADADIVYSNITGKTLSGTVTLRLNAVKVGGKYQSFRIKSPITIVGDLCSVDCSTAPEATITWNTQPANGQVGSADFAYAVSCSDGSAVTVTSADPSIATIVDGKLHYVAAGTTHLVASATDACGNEITQNSNDFTVTAASVDPDPEPGTCVTIFEAKATSKTAFSATTGTITSSNLSEGDELNKDGYKFAVKPNNSNALKIAPKAGETFKVGDKLTFVVYTAKDKEIGFVIGGNTYTQSVNKSLYYFEQELTKTDITDGATTITFNRNSGDARWVEVKIERCAQLPPCTTPVLEDLSAQTKCPGSNVSWTAIVNNTEALQDGEMIAYQWNKKGNNTVLSSEATLTLNGITEAAGGTYVVTATVSADGKASATATKEVTLTVTPATATPTITASASTVYAGNPVTLKATCLSSGVTYQWYTCNDAEGTNAQAIGGATNTTYTFTAGAAGTYYYKVIVTGDGTHSCGDAEKVYTLVVSAAIDASDCTTYFWFPYAQDATTNDVTNNENKFFGNSPRTGDNNLGTYQFKLDDITYTATRNTGASEFTLSFTVPENSIGTMAINCKGSSSKPLYLKHTDNTEILVSNSSSIKSFVIENITPGTWTLQSSGSWTLSGMAVKVCSASTCTDPQVTATVDNATICAGTKSTVTFTATNYADGATLQWQKKNGNNWDGISGATSATYTISSVTTAHAGQYRVIAEKGCKRISEEVTLTVLTAPTFNDFAKTASVMKGNALAISDVQATGATGYAWYKSSDNSFDAAADTKVGTSKDLLLAAASITEEAEQIFYLFCVASNSCGSVTSNAITVTVTPFVEEECATKGNEGEREFGFTNTSCSSITYESKSAWETNSSKEYLTYTAPAGRYFATAKVTVAHTNNSKAVYGYSTNGGTTWTYEETYSAVPDAYTTITIELPADVNAFCIGRNMDGKGTGTGKFYLAEICFTYTTMCTETTLTAGSYNNEYNISTQMDFVEPTFTLKSGENTLEGQTLTYTSSNTAIATVDEDGNVTFEGMTGTVTITATFAGGEISETEYCACQGSYTITVGCKDQAPKIVAAAGTNLNGCNNSITLEAKMQDGTAFADGTFQWYRDGEAIEGATSASYIVVRAGTYTVSRTYTCTTMSSKSAVVTNEKVEPEVERLTPFQYYHVDKTYSNQMKNRHLFAVTSYGTLDGKRYHLTATRNGETLDLSSSTAFFTIPSSDNAVDTVMIDLNELTNKYAEGDEIVITCAPINNCNTASAITASITIHVIDQTPTLALICSGADGEGTRATKELVVGGDFLTGYNKADLCQQTSNTTFDPNTEWGFYTELKENYIVTPVNGYAEFNKLNYEPFDILLLTDYPKASKSEAAATILDDMAALCDYRPLLSLKAHMVAKSPSKWAAKGFTTSPVVPAVTSQYANIVCYAHPMFAELDDAHVEGIYHDHDDFNQLVYKILTGPGHESSKGLQGFELKDADNFVTIGLIHYNAAAEVVTHTEGEDTHTHLEWTPAADDRQLVAIAERQANIEARMILFAINCGAQSMQTPMGRQVLLTCLEYLLQTDPLQVADCRLTFDNGDGNTNWGTSHYGGTGTKGDGKWSTAANWGPEYKVVPGRNNDVRIAAPCTVDADKVEVLSVHITEDGSLTIPADKSFTARSTILRADEDGNVYPTNVEDISLGSNAGGNASLILNNERGDTKAGVAMYSTAEAAKNYSAADSKWQYIGTPHSDVKNAVTNYYNSWLYQYDTGTEGWKVIPNGGPLDPFRGYCITHPERGHTYWMEGTLAATTNQDITIPAGKFVVVANSWTAPIQINELTDDDMEGLRENTIYFFNTGSDPNQAGELNKENGRYAAGTYVSVPIHSAPYTGDSYIPSMQGFYVVGGTTDGTLHLDYERHVRAPRTNTPSGPMHAPARRVAADNEPQVAKFLFRGKRYDDRLIILERPDFTRGYDSGWDGEQWGGNAAAPMSYVVAETRYDAVSAIPEYEGTIIGFRAGEDSEYTIHFDYDGMEDALYLLDTDTQIYTRVLKGNSYTFTCADKAEHNRFILTRKAPQIATGTDHINTGENAKAVKFIKDDKIFIFVNGMLYDATGKMVIR